MPFTLDNIVQSSTGSFDSTSGTADLGAVGTEAGNAVVILAGLEGDNVTVLTMTTPAGFTAVQALGANTSQGRVHALIKPAASAGEGVAGSTPWTLAVSGGSAQCAWAAFEITGSDLDWSDKVYVHSGTVSAGASTVTSKLVELTGSNAPYTYNGVALAAFFAAETTPTTPTVDGFTDGFTEYVTQTVSDGGRAHRLTVAAKNVQAVGTMGCTAAVSPASYVSGWMLVFTGVESHHATDLLTCFGAEIGTATNITASTLLDSVTAPFDEVVGTPAVVTTTPRSGTYCLEISSTGAAESVAWAQRASPARGTLGQAGITTLPSVWLDRLYIRFPSALPSVDVDLGTLEAGSAANGAVLWYRTATQKLGAKVGTGTEVASDATLAADQWIGVDRFYDPRTTTHTFDWAVDYNATPGDLTGAVTQSRASTAGMTAAGVSRVRYGHTGTLTATYRLDDIAASRQRKNYPIGDVRVLPLKVDPAGTPAVVGTAGNFRTFTGNGGTLTAWSAADTRTRLSNIPPVVGASATGLAQVTAAASDYVEVPMETFTCAPDYAPIGGRWYWAGWAASGTTAQFGFRATDSSISPLVLGLVNPADAEFDNSTLRWVTVVHRQNTDVIYPFTQAVVAALLAHFGLSSDVTPDAGVLGVVFELVVQTARVESIFGSLVAAGVDPATGGIVRIDVDAPAGATSTSLYYEETGTPTTVPVTGGTSHTETIGAPDATVVNYIAVATPAEPAPTD